MIRRPPRSTLFPTRRSSDLVVLGRVEDLEQRRRRVTLERDPELVHLVEQEHRVLGAGLLHPLNDPPGHGTDRKSTRLNSSHSQISYAVFCLKKKKKKTTYSQ